MKALMTLGRLVNIEVYDPKTKKTAKKTYRGKWVAASPGGRTMHICTVKKRSTSKKVPRSISAAHRRFHGENGNSEAWEGDCPSVSGKLTLVGWVEALTYAVPKSIKSPEKNPYHWRHAFGDTGHADGKRRDKYPSRYYPALYKDGRGNLFIRRRKGNIWKVTDWIIG